MKQTEINGFTLIELLVAMAISAVAIIIVVSAYTIQVRGQKTQEALTEMNQAARAGFEMIIDEIHLAGLDPLGTANARIITANAGELVFSMDRGDGATNQSNGDCCDGNEVVRYHLSNDADDNGVNDNIVTGVQCDLGREFGRGLDLSMSCAGGTSGLQPLIRNVDVLNFVYLNAAGVVIPTPIAGAADLDSIHSIQLTIVVRAGTVSSGFLYSFTNNDVYLNIQGAQVLPAQGDAFRRLRLATAVQCRNIGP